MLPAERSRPTTGFATRHQITIVALLLGGYSLCLGSWYYSKQVYDEVGNISLVISAFSYLEGFANVVIIFTVLINEDKITKGTLPIILLVYLVCVGASFYSLITPIYDTIIPLWQALRIASFIDISLCLPAPASWSEIVGLRRSHKIPSPARPSFAPGRLPARAAVNTRHLHELGNVVHLLLIRVLVKEIWGAQQSPIMTPISTVAGKLQSALAPGPSSQLLEEEKLPNKDEEGTAPAVSLSTDSLLPQVERSCSPVAVHRKNPSTERSCPNEIILRLPRRLIIDDCETKQGT